jgi:SAM-dependent methyltransferase
VSEPNLTPVPRYVMPVRDFFDAQYTAHNRYWWRGANRYSTSPADHTLFNAVWLAAAAQRRPGLALDLGAGEGADAIRLAKLGYDVDVVEVSAVACEKAERFARAEGVRVNVRCEPIETARLAGTYDVVLMNGCLHYVRDKSSVLTRVTAASAADAVHAVAVFSTATPIPAEHAVIPAFPDEEGGTVEQFYNGWQALLHSYERDRSEHSHPGFAPHAHSYIKLIAARRPEWNGAR